MSNTIDRWSYSRLKIFEQCPYRAKLQYIDKIPEPERTLPPGKKEFPNDRGSRIHDLAENFVRGKIDFPFELKKFEPEFEKAKLLFAEGKVEAEGDWAFDKDWEATGWNEENTWGRLKLDLLLRLTPEQAVIVDHKTGQRFGNEISHAEQLQLYQLVTFIRYPEIERIVASAWYLDKDELTEMTFTRRQGLRFFNGFDRRAKAMTTAKKFPAKPNMFACKWCPYSPQRSGDCKYGV